MLLLPITEVFLNHLARYERNGKKLSIHQKLNHVCVWATQSQWTNFTVSVRHWAVF